jgi:transcriptional regulator with XRE-family HTH domain
MEGLRFRVKLLRKAAGITQRELARIAGCNRTTVVNIENGRQRPTVNFLAEIGVRLNVSIDWIVLGRTAWADGHIALERKIIHGELDKLSFEIKQLIGDTRLRIEEHGKTG